MKDSVPLFQLNGVWMSYADGSGTRRQVLTNADVCIADGQVTAVVGVSGSGKSTLLWLLSGLAVPDRGEILFRGRPLPRREGPELRMHRSRATALVFQDLNLILHLTAEENVALPQLCRGEARSAALARARYLLEEVGMAALAKRRFVELSGGEKQRVAVVRAFASDSQAILADEPTGSLDPAKAADVMKLFTELGVKKGKPVVVVTHNHDLAREYCHRVITCSGGRFSSVEPAQAREAQGGLDEHR